jgi:hypothetical protein
MSAFGGRADIATDDQHRQKRHGDVIRNCHGPPSPRWPDKPCIKIVTNLDSLAVTHKRTHFSAVFSQARTPARLSHPCHTPRSVEVSHRNETALCASTCKMRLLTQLGISRMAEDERLEQYRLNAEKCLTLAQRFNNRESKHALLGMAKAWLTLAEQHVKNSKTVLVYETPPPVNEPPKPQPVSEPPPVNDPPPVSEPLALRLNPPKPDDPMQC